MRNLNIPEGLDGIEAIKWIKANKSYCVKAKKSVMKQADAVCFSQAIVNKDGQVSKDAMPAESNPNELKNSTVINTALWYDSHGDVHLPGIWNKSLSDNSRRSVNDIMLLQEHKMMFDKIIADGPDVTAYAKKMSWRELGVDADGETESLIFDNVIKSGRNPYMFGQYSKGHVKNHSVGMYYVGINLAIGYKHKDFKEENDLWDKWIDLIPNKEEAIEDGMFWAVSEAKVIEGSAVPRGSNVVTPTLSSKAGQAPNAPESPSTQKQPSDIFSLINKIY